jgi:hypothetical protein
MSKLSGTVVPPSYLIDELLSAHACGGSDVVGQDLRVRGMLDYIIAWQTCERALFSRHVLMLLPTCSMP